MWPRSHSAPGICVPALEEKARQSPGWDQRDRQNPCRIFMARFVESFVDQFREAVAEVTEALRRAEWRRPRRLPQGLTLATVEPSDPVRDLRTDSSSCSKRMAALAPAGFGEPSAGAAQGRASKYSQHRVMP